MSFSILTNVTSLQAQNYLRINSNFQSQTINQVTSGLRIVNSGDDAAGLAIANGYRSNEAVLTQGIQNANDGLSQLQTADGGLSNISQLLDRARTLATESASGAFTGDRGVLNSEFQSVLGEINRQAQAIGLSQGGTLAKNLSVFIGGGQAGNGISATQNGSIGINLSQSAVDTQNLGLTGVQASGAAGTDIGAGSATTSLSAILANATNTGTEATPGYTSFTITGPGFAGQGVNISVNTANLASTSDLVTAINSAITAAAAGGTQQATALSNAGIIAGINTDSTGKEQLSFASSSTAFQVKANDRVANALLGNFAQNATLKGSDAGPTVDTTTGLTPATLTLAVDGGTAFNVSVTAGASTSKAQIVKDLNADTQFSAVATAHLEGDQVVLESNGNNANSKIQITATTLSTNLGLSTTAATAANPSTGASLNTYATAATETAAGATTFGAAGAGTITFQFQGAGQTTPTNLQLNVTAGTTVAQAIAALQTGVAGNAALQKAGITLTTSTATDALGFTSTSGQPFSVQVTGDTQNLLGFGSFVAGANNSFDYSTLTGNAYNSPAGTAAGTANLEFSINGGASNGNLVSIDLGGGDATAATITGTAVADPVNIDSTNNTLNVNVDGTGVQVTLVANPEATLNNIAAEISSQLNTALGTSNVNYATVVNNQLTIATATKGADQSVEIGTGSANNTLGLTATAFSQGTARSGDSIATALNAAFAANSSLQAAGLTADYGVTSAGKITISSNNGTYFRTDEYGTATSAEVSGTAAFTTAVDAALRSGATAGSYTINATNNIFSVKIDGGSEQDITLTQGTRTAQQVVNDINAQLTGAVASVNGSGDIQILSNSTGGSSSVEFLGATAATNGTATGSVAQGAGFNIDGGTSGTETGSTLQGGGGYTITTGVNDTIKINVDGNGWQVVTLQGTETTAQNIVDTLNTVVNGGLGLIGAHASVVGSGASAQVAITSDSTGATSSVQFDTSVTDDAAAYLGFTNTAQTGTAGTNNTLSISVDGGSAQTVTLTAGATQTAQNIADDINAINGGLGLVGAHASITGVGAAAHVVITSLSTGATSGIQINANGNDAAATLGLLEGVQAGYQGANAVDSAATPLGLTAGTSTATVPTPTDVNIATGVNDTLNLTIDGTQATVVLAAGDTTVASAVTQINTQLNTQLGTVGQNYASAQNGRIEIASLTSGAGSSVHIGTGNANNTLGLSVGTTYGTAADLGFGITGATFTGNIAGPGPVSSPSVDVGGASQTAALSFTPIATGGDNQTISISAADSTGTQQSLSITLSNNSTSRSGQTIDQALNAINTALLQSNNSTLQKIVAVKDDSSGTEQIRFLSTLPAFQVSIGSTPDGAGVGSQGTTAASTVSAGGSIADISNITSATAAVQALANSVTILGNSQAVVGRGENQFNYAINLAQSQLTNTAAAESSIRDANLAAESANLTKAQILLQAGVAALAQANSAPQAILKLLQ